ncbi:uncharacterized protein TNCV_3172241 [Trichonephila clavipes]|nr:uncharacterized protein TNCV_3172241 [Trichonephila clavipes]
MAPHRPRKSTPTESTTDEDDMIMYDVQAEELEPNPEDKVAVMECFVNNPSEYMRALTPTRFRNIKSPSTDMQLNWAHPEPIRLSRLMNLPQFEVDNLSLSRCDTPMYGVRSNSWDAQLAVPNDPRYAQLKTNLGIGQVKEG